MAVKRESIYKTESWEEDDGVYLMEQEAGRPPEAMSRKERKIYKQRK